MQISFDITQRNVLLLIPTTKMNELDISQVIKDVGIKARYNVGPIPQSLPNTYAPAGRMIFPMSIQERIFNPLEMGDYSDFDISACWDRRMRKDIAVQGPSKHLISAAFVSISDLESLHTRLAMPGTFIWHWSQWVSLSRLEQMRWAY